MLKNKIEIKKINKFKKKNTIFFSIIIIIIIIILILITAEQIISLQKKVHGINLTT